MENKRELFGTNVFAKAFQEFDEDAFFKNLHEQVKNKPYYKKYKGFKITITCLSYVFNVGSALTASYAIFWLIQWITGIAVVGYIISAVFLVFLEQIKRKSSNELWQVWFFNRKLAMGWLLLSLCCFGVSLASSAFGVKQGTEELAPDPELLAADSLATHYQAEITKLEAKNEDLRNNRDRNGITFYKLADGIDANELVIADYRKRLLELDKKTEGKNEKLTTAYQSEVKMTAWTLVWITLLMEVLFEACIAYIWYFSFRSYVERRKLEQETTVQTDENEAPTPPAPTHNVDVQALAQHLKKLQNEIQALRASEFSKTNTYSSKSNLNGTEPKNGLKKPIGSFTSKQLQEMELETAPIAAAEEVCTDVDRTANDLYTVEHTYTRSGQTKTVRYTLSQIEARIAQYEREFAEAEEKQSDESVLQNRSNWISYWKDKREELIVKLEGFSVKLS